LDKGPDSHNVRNKTNLALEIKLLAGVSLHVVLQIAFLTEALRALVTPVGLLSGVSPHVALQRAFLTEELRALVAPVGLLVGVSHHVDLQYV
jgi:hypothetical protein